MAVEGIRVRDDGGAGRSWETPKWGRVYTAAEEVAAEFNAPGPVLRPFQTEEPKTEIVMRRQPGQARLHAQRAKTMGSYPASTNFRSSSESPQMRKHLTATGVQGALGLDCFELRRRSRNEELAAKRLSYNSRTNSVASDRSNTTTNSDAISFATDETLPSIGKLRRDRQHGPVRRIQSLNRYTAASARQENRDSYQLSWESLRNKPPRPPTAHSSSTASPPPQTTATTLSLEDDIRVGRPLNLEMPKSRSVERRASPNLSRAVSEPESAIIHHRNLTPSPPKSVQVHVVRTAAPQIASEVFSPKSSNQRNKEGSKESPVHQIPVAPFAMTAYASSTFAQISDDGNLPQPQFTPISRLHQRQPTSISLYELLQFCQLTTVHIPPTLFDLPPRRNSWKAGEVVPGLGIRVSVVGLRFPLLGRSPRLQMAGSAFTQVARGRSQPEPPLVVIIEEVTMSSGIYFQPGQLILEVNGLNLFAVPVTSRQGLMTRLVQAIASAVGEGNEDGLYMTLASPNSSLVQRANQGTLDALVRNQ